MKKRHQPEQVQSLLLQRIRAIWEGARGYAARSVNSAHVCGHWLIGHQIVEEEQSGADRAAYGSALLEHISTALMSEYGTGFSVSSLKYMRSFYLSYPELILIRHALRDESPVGEADPTAPTTLRSLVAHPGILGSLERAVPEALTAASQEIAAGQWMPGKLHPGMSWSHYRTLLRVRRREARDFYEIEALKNGWAGRQLERQIDSMLFERLSKSRDKAAVLRLATEGQIILKPTDMLKEPFVLEFLDLPESHRLLEANLEQAILNHLQDFLLELGTGFAFVGRQVRLTLDGDHFYSDLIFYHIRLKCYVIIDLKTRKLEAADLGQMLLYVHYYDREVAGSDDNPTIGLILCTEKNDSVVRYVLDEQNEQIFASRYQMMLPSEELLRSELQKELERLDGIVGDT